jgi:Lsr2
VAQKVQVILVDDLDGGSAAETVVFALDGTTYEIDLSSKNAGQLRASFATYVESARKSGAARGARRAGGGRRSAARSGNKTAEIRAWARDQKIKVSERGRIAADVVEKYNSAHK